MSESKYTYPGTDVLINKAGLQDQEKLKAFEALHTGMRNLELLTTHKLNGDFDLQHLQSIHKYLFQDVYPFAGQIRDESISKDTFLFAPHQHIKPYSQEIFTQLKKENFLKGSDLNKFSERAAYFMAEINVLHPFREGNGRTQREFIRSLAESSGYYLDWSANDKSKVLQASIRSKVDTKPLEEIIRSSLQPIEREITPQKKLTLADKLSEIETKYKSQESSIAEKKKPSKEKDDL